MKQVCRATVVGGAVLVLLGVVFPRVIAAPWPAIADTWRTLSAAELAVLTTVWFAGLLAHTSVLMAALPGLSRRRALTLNLTGSAVSNLVPLGGGLGIGLNYAMVRRWGFSAGEFSGYAATSNVCSVLVKALLPFVAMVALVVGDVGVGAHLMLGAAAGSGLLMLGVLAAVALVGSARGERVVASIVTGLPARLCHIGSGDARQVVARLALARRAVVLLIRAGWRRMVAGMVTYCALQALLLGLCLALLGSRLTPVAVLSVFAAERALTAVPVTPGGSGLVEIGTTALALALGGSATGSAGGVLLYRALTFGMEIPVGAVWLLCWLALQRSSGRLGGRARVDGDV